MQLAWALDLDGVLWTGIDPIDRSAEAVERLRTFGSEVVFVTNNSFSTISEQEKKLASFGVDATGAVFSSAMAGAQLVEPGERAFVLGGPGIVEALGARQADVVAANSVELGKNRQQDNIDAVVVGLDWELSYERLVVAVQAVLNGARFIATNTDTTYPTERGLFPGAGAIVAAVERATGVQPTIAGKPYQALARLVTDRVGSSGIMVGDRPETDGEFANSLGYRFGLVLSGITKQDDLPVVPSPDLVANTLWDLVSGVLDAG